MGKFDKQFFRRLSYKILVSVGEFTLFMMGLSVILIVFQVFIGQVFFNFLVQYAKIEDDAAAKFIMFI